MKRSHLAFSLVCLLCLWLSACGGMPSTKSTAPAPIGPQKIKVTIGDFYIHSPVTTFTTGTPYQFLVTNVGTHYHNFLIMRPMEGKESTAMTVLDVYKQSLIARFNIAPNQTTALDFTFKHIAPSGLLELSCHYGGHYEAGMHQAITVKAAPGASVSSYPNHGIPLAANSQAPTGPCDPPSMTQIINGTYTPASISLKMGDTLAILATGNQSYTPTVIPENVRRIFGGSSNTTYIIFPVAGTYTLSIQGHPEAKATVSVSKTAGSTCGMNPVATVNFNANYATDPKSRYFFTPIQVTIKKGQSIMLSNLVDLDLTFISTPNAGLGKVESQKYRTQNILFATAGTYTISCVQFPNKKFAVTVQDT